MASPSSSCRQCKDLLRHVHNKNLEIASLKDQLAELSTLRLQRHDSLTKRAFTKSIEPQPPQPFEEEIRQLREECMAMKEEKAQLLVQIDQLKSQLGRTASDKQTHASPDKAEESSSPTSHYATQDDGVSRPESQQPSAAQTPRDPMQTTRVSSSHCTPRSAASRRSLSATPASRGRSSPSNIDLPTPSARSSAGSRASESRRGLNETASKVLQSATKSPDLQRAAMELYDEFERSAMLHTEVRFARRARANPKVLSDRIASLSPGRHGAAEQPQRAVAAIAGWRAARLPIGDRPLVVTTPRDLPPAPPSEVRISESSTSPFAALSGDHFLRVASGSMRRNEWDDAVAAKCDAALRDLRATVMRADRVAYLTMQNVEFSRDPCGPFKASFASIKQIVATHARLSDDDRRSTVADGSTWPVTEAQLDMIPAALGGALARYLKQCVCAFDYMCETAHSAQCGTLLTLRDFFANIETLAKIAARPRVSVHL